MNIHGDGSKVALLLHGMASSSNTWKELIADLVANDFIVYAPDLPGHGLGTKDPELYSLEKWKELILKSVPAVDLLVGHSMGGLLAIKLRSELKPLKTILVDPVLRFPAGPFKLVAQNLFNGSMQFARLSKNEALRLNILTWDRLAVRMIESPKGLKALDESVLVIRPRNSYVAPLGVFKKVSGAKVLTLPRTDHNLHLGSYPRFFAAVKAFVFPENNPENSVDRVALCS